MEARWGRGRHGAQHCMRAVPSHRTLSTPQTINPPVTFCCDGNPTQTPDGHLLQPNVICLSPTLGHFLLLPFPAPHCPPEPSVPFSCSFLAQGLCIGHCSCHACSLARPPLTWMILSHQCKIHEGKDCACPGHHCTPNAYVPGTQKGPNKYVLNE